MRFLIVNADYPAFLQWLYAGHPGLEERPFAEQMRVRMASLMGVADFHSNALRELGHEAYDVHLNNAPAQRAWAREHGVAVEEDVGRSRWWQQWLQPAKRLAARTPLRHFKSRLRPVVSRLVPSGSWLDAVFAGQVRHYQPDVLLIQAMAGVKTHLLRELKPRVRLLVGEISSPLPVGEDLRCYDLVVSSLPGIVTRMRERGVNSQLHRLAFDPRVVEKLGDEQGSPIQVSFVGSLFAVHSERIRFLEDVCRRLPLSVWGPGVEQLRSRSPLRACYRGQAWGADQYRVLARSQVTLNYHIDVAGSYANNLRLYEATGVRTCLLTDWKVNLSDLFQEDVEIVAYRSADECVEKTLYLLEHEDERQAMADAGQRRTLRDHTYAQRVGKLVQAVRSLLSE
jgi:spore maturation protein CgeB